MTREEAIEIIISIDKAYRAFSKEEYKALEMAIKALEQEPCDHYTEGYFKGYDDGQKGKLEQEPCDDAISRQTVLDGLASIAKAKAKSDAQKSMMGRTMFFVEQLPSVSTEKTGHWIEQIDHEENCRTLICSNCDRPALHDEDSIWKHKFCPHCGAKMEVENG